MVETRFYTVCDETRTLMYAGTKEQALAYCTGFATGLSNKQLHIESPKQPISFVKRIKLLFNNLIKKQTVFTVQLCGSILFKGSYWDMMAYCNGYCDSWKCEFTFLLGIETTNGESFAFTRTFGENHN